MYSIRLYINTICQWWGIRWCAFYAYIFWYLPSPNLTSMIKTDILLNWVQIKDKGFNSFCRYVRTCGSHHDFLHKGLLLTWKLLTQGFLVVKLRSSPRKLQCRTHEFVTGVTRRMAHVEHLRSLQFLYLSYLGSCCFCCQIECLYVFWCSMKRCLIRLELCLLWCFVNDIWMSSYILASCRIFISDDVRVVKT